ncbi:MAG: YkgJ family cysteine cluster protein [Moraxellaceae bacterium]
MPTPEFSCRSGCGACCIAPSITSPIPGMPEGKPAGTRCIQLDENNLCKIFDQPERPAFCGSLKASLDMCGQSNIEALHLLSLLEAETAPAKFKT